MAERSLTIGELLASNYAPDSQLFVRPSDDSKSFTGRVLRFAECGGFFRELQARSANVVVAEVQDIEAEYRLFVVDSKVVGGSMYRPTADRDIPLELIGFAERAAFCFNGSRFYDAGVAAVVDAVSRFQAERW